MIDDLNRTDNNNVKNTNIDISAIREKLKDTALYYDTFNENLPNVEQIRNDLTDRYHSHYSESEKYCSELENTGKRKN